MARREYGVHGRRSTPEQRGAMYRWLTAGETSTVDYADQDCRCAEVVVDRALREGFVPAVSVLALDRLPHASPYLRARIRSAAVRG